MELVRRPSSSRRQACSPASPGTSPSGSCCCAEARMSAPDSTALRRVAGVAGLACIVLYFAGNFPTGIGYEFHSGRPPAEVVSWVAAHESIVHFGVFVDLVADLLFAGFLLLLVALSRT